MAVLSLVLSYGLYKYYTCKKQQRQIQRKLSSVCSQKSSTLVYAMGTDSGSWNLQSVPMAFVCVHVHVLLNNYCLLYVLFRAVQKCLSVGQGYHLWTFPWLFAYTVFHTRRVQWPLFHILSHISKTLQVVDTSHISK